MIKRGKGLIKDSADPRDHVFKFKSARVANLPPAVDLRKHYPPIMDQGTLGSCVFNSTTGVARWHIIRAGAPDKPLSRLQSYYDARALENCIGEDTGAEIRTGIKCLQKIGIGEEKLWPYRIERFKEKPPASVYKYANMFGALTYERVPTSISGVKQALYQKGPVIIGLDLFESFESEEVEKSGIVPMPDPENEYNSGGHAMVVVGYGQKKGYFTVANSWSMQWGDKGFCYIPEKYIGSPKLGGDYWVVAWEHG